MLSLASLFRTLPLCLGLFAIATQPLKADEDPSLHPSGGCSHSHHRSSRSHDKCEKPCETHPVCLDSLMASSTYSVPTPITFSLFPTATPIPFTDALVAAKGRAICRVSDTMFRLNEPGVYFIDVTIYPNDTSTVGNTFALQAKDSNGAVIFTGPLIVQNTTGAVPFQQIYKVDCTVPQLIQVVGYSPTAGGIFTFSEGRGASISIIKICDLPKCKVDCCRTECCDGNCSQNCNSCGW